MLKLVTQLTLNIGLGIYVQRIGDRNGTKYSRMDQVKFLEDSLAIWSILEYFVSNNDSDCCEAGRMRFLGIFYAFNHPIHREEEYHHLRNKVIYPAKLKKLRTRNTTYTTSNVIDSQ